MRCCLKPSKSSKKAGKKADPPIANGREVSAPMTQENNSEEHEEHEIMELSDVREDDADSVRSSEDQSLVYVPKNRPLAIIREDDDSGRRTSTGGGSRKPLSRGYGGGTGNEKVQD